MSENRPKLSLETGVKVKQTIRTVVSSGAITALMMAGVLMTTSSSEEPLDEVYFTTTTPAELVVCGDQETFEIEYMNASGFGLTGQELSLSLPEGVEYVPGSIQNTSGHGVAEADISDAGTPVFSIGDVDDGGVVQFSLDYSARLDGMTYILAGNTPRNQIELTANEGLTSYEAEAYNMIYASLNITYLNPTSQTINSGDTTTRSITVVNAGNGKLPSFYLVDTHGEGIELVSTDLGTINTSRDTIFLSSSDFQSIGNGDSFFDTNESLSLTESLAGTGCTDGTISSVIQAVWGCGAQSLVNASSNAHVTVNLKTPNLSISSSTDMVSCFGAGEPNAQQIKLVNNGEGRATEVQVEIWKSTGGSYDQSVYSKIDTASITISRDSEAAQDLNPTTVENTLETGGYACLGSNPVGKVYLDLPDILPGETILIDWNTISCCVNACQDEVNTGWRYKVSYDDVCETTDASSTKTGEGTLDALMTVFTESPSDIQHDQTEDFSYTISSHTNEFPEGDGAYYEYVFDIPAGLTWSGLSTDLEWTMGPNSWSYFYADNDTVARQVTARFALPEAFDIPKSEVLIRLTGNCNAPGASSGELDVNLNVNFVPDSSCSSICGIPMLCNETVSVDLHCPGACEAGLAFDAYDISRISFGEADNDQDGKPDSNGRLDYGQVKTHRAMVSDTLEGVFEGTVHTSATYPAFAYGYAQTTIEKGGYMRHVSAAIEVQDASSGQTLSCDGVVVSTETSGEDQIFRYDFSASTLASACSDFDGFEFGEGDEITLTVRYWVRDNMGGQVEEVEVENDYFALSTMADPSSAQRQQCNDWDGKFTMIGYFFQVSDKKNVTVKGCEKVVSRSYYMSIGDCCSNFNGGNIFPYEYRNWGHVKKAMVVLPPDYTIVDMYTKQFRTKFTNSSATQTENDIAPIYTGHDTLIFDLEQYYEPHGGKILYSDDGFSGTLYLRLAPTCEVPENTWQNLHWEFTFVKADRLRIQ